MRTKTTCSAFRVGRSIIIPVIMFGWSVAAVAQPQPGDVRLTDEQAAEIARARAVEAAPTALRNETSERIATIGQNVSSSADGIQSQGATVSFTGSQSEGRGAFTLELLSRAGSDRLRSDGNLTVENDRFAVEFATEVGDDEDSADFLNLGGVPGGTSATLTWTRYSASTQIGGDAVQMTRARVDRARTACFDRVLPNYPGDESVPAFKADLAARAQRGDDLHTSMVVGTGALRERYRGISLYLAPRCYGAANDAELIRANLSEAESTAYQLELFGARPLLFFGASASVGTDEYDFIDLAGFSEESSNKVEWSVGGHVGMIAAKGRFSARATASYGREWDDADDIDICRPQPSGPLSDCLRGPGAPPTHQDQFTAKGEVRIIVPLGSLELGLAPSVGYQTGDDQFTAALPIYFVPDSDGKLTGGVRFGYDSEADDEWSAGIFISVPLGPFF